MDYVEEEEGGEITGPVPGVTTEPHDSKGFQRQLTAAVTQTNGHSNGHSSGALATATTTLANKIREARMKGYEGDPCGGCGSFTLVRNGVCMKCETCGTTSGCS
jgi:ribonucleoside-diphosphate reductase alpha chain